ncbi:Exopolysaccharide biosynthesis protein YbjH [Roseovarius nanhaiticus]|uniref:Exopolysaccharide biosynthesis protein YbjH n=1 Tax=Roseovarius nanhaiticus TaxID=573024 RepID=A0A1N7EPF3_9RHOB|nr:YjbH domain-containing protein [Roseovarius nanhaiticus]SEK69931.1 Exopolysaccharide biosynthesis protein YbjH [Roseovarius nanhaiticus]SIR89983.1 Exopolysaccharide biosynthesis protein YbjH [Roseovarius nanhaiticus]
MTAKCKTSAKMAAAAALLGCAPFTASADPLTTEQTNMYGTPGSLIDMPTSEMAPDGQLSTTVSAYGMGSNLSTRTTLTFQVLPKLSASFRYSAIGGLVPIPGRPAFDTLYDRSFDIKYRLFNETRYRPAVSIGLRDFIGTGIYSGEYIVATKSVLDDKLRFSGGLGWGRLGSYASFGSTGTRPNETLGKGGIPTYDRWFRGDVGAFAGVSWKATERLTFSAEYSSDAYDREVSSNALTRRTPWNFGVSYRVSEALAFNAYALHGDEIGASFTLSINAKEPAVIGGAESAPLPVSPRAAGSASDLGWTSDESRKTSAKATLTQLLDREGIKTHALSLEAREAHIQIRNTRYDVRAQAVGRTARAMTRSLPASVEVFTITQVVDGIPTSTTRLSRSDLERLENAPAAEILEVARITDPVEAPQPSLMPDAYPRFEYGIGPYLRFSVFDPENPVRYNAGIKAQANYHFAPGWVVSGAVSQKVIGNLDDVSLPGASGLPRVRSNVALYNRTDEPTIDYLTVSKYGRPGRNFYSRVSAGYLERMYAGLSGEILWKPQDSRVALGAEINYVQPRDYDQQFGLRSRSTPNGTIPEWNGHVSAYYDVGYGFHTQLDVGQYLAGDFGATLSVDRVFANGWSIGAYATKTDVSSDTFGEGSFDKGIRIDIPLSWGIGTPTLQKSRTVLKSLSRDGGARLEVDGRLYDRVKDTHATEMAKSWGKFWR